MSKREEQVPSRSSTQQDSSACAWTPPACARITRTQRTEITVASASTCKGITHSSLLFTSHHKNTCVAVYNKCDGLLNEGCLFSPPFSSLPSTLPLPSSLPPPHPPLHPQLRIVPVYLMITPQENSNISFSYFNSKLFSVLVLIKSLNASSTKLFSKMQYLFFYIKR